ncbi:class I SAM-dependent methyltransferase [Frateuria edaphi]|uniref:class I SAM-dependent methyltransferase n=1 Tax=Frateuria edaphi TaxID=2898793 RepID=UPI001E464ECC|nr:class I SAM-dependent methyltransferase [Frateuria edaphi]UGB44840.1 class I SAM-dependent methyltransferase [Frateuria edaphi]
MRQPAFPNGHFYSPVVDRAEADKDADRIWPAAAKPVRGIDLNYEGHQRLLREVFPAVVEGFAYPTSGPTDDTLEHFYDFNGQFERQDPKVAFCLLQTIRPRRIVEVGSGYSTLLTMDVNQRFLGGAAAITCIEPYPRPFLRRAASEGKIALIEERAQTVDEFIFTSLADGDVLFIDSSHVGKTGSDVNRLILEILPILAEGVYVHFHDIFLPLDYPERWVRELGFSWNEQYLLQAFLAFNPVYSIVYGSAIARELHTETLGAFLKGTPMQGGSLWLRRNQG